MSETSSPTDEQIEEVAGGADRHRPATRQAWVVVAILTLISTLVLVEFAFSTANDSQSVDGSTATSSRYTD